MSVEPLPQEFLSQIEAAGDAPLVLAVVRNEALRLPHWLAHYRAMGVRRFAVIDNGSDDGTHELLAAQEDVTSRVLQSSFAAANFGIAWVNQFLERASPGGWVIHVDADECIVYPGWPGANIDALLAEADASGSDAVPGFLLDMYPDGPITAATPSEHGGLFGAAPCFDADYRFRARPRKPWDPGSAAIEVLGGPRIRLLSSMERETASTWVDYWLRGQIDRLLPYAPDAMVPLVVRSMPRQMPALSKVPLVRLGGAFRYDNNHGGSGGRLHRRNVVVCHFKFLADFEERVRREAARKEHYRRGAEYIMYADALARSGALDFRYPGSLRFRDAAQLAELGLFRDFTPPA